MSIVTFNFTHASELRRFSILLPSTAAPYPLPVVLTLECRATTEQQATGSWLQRYEASAARLGIAMVGLTTTDRRLEPPAAPVRECWDWPNDGIINDAQPQACDSSDSKDVGYLQYVLDFLAARPQSFDSTQLYLEGFSKDAVAAAVLAYCFPTRIAGVYQGGSALLVRGLEPTIYHHIGTECTQTGYETLGEDCRTIAPCTACQYLGIVPCWSPRRPMVHCLGSFADDYFAPAQDHMYALAAREGHDVRMMRYAPSAEAAGHVNPRNHLDWVVGCLGVVPTCSAQCATSFGACMDVHVLAAAP